MDDNGQATGEMAARAQDSDSEHSDDGLENYSRIEKIGQGTFGKVYKAVDKRTKKVVALKRIIDCASRMGDSTIDSMIVREIAFMRQLEHPNLLRLEDVILGKMVIHLVFEYMYLDLSLYLKQLPPLVYMERWLQKSYQYQILQGMCYCHQRAILHRDLKPSNLLLNTDGAIKIADFGWSREISLPTRAVTGVAQTPNYRAPEIMLGTLRYTPAIDMWSVGCIFAEMATKEILFPGGSDGVILNRVFQILTTPSEQNWKGVSELPLYTQILFPRHEVDHLDEMLSQYMDPIGIAVVRLLLQYDPAKRASAKELLKHPYYADVDRSKLPAPDYDGTLQQSSSPSFFARRASSSSSTSTTP